PSKEPKFHQEEIIIETAREAINSYIIFNFSLSIITDIDGNFLFVSFMVTKSSCRSNSFRVDNFEWNYIKITIRGVLATLICLRQVDLKALIAYSSVAHIGIVLSCVVTITYIGICASYTLIIAYFHHYVYILNSLYLQWGYDEFYCSLNLLSEIFLINRLVSRSWVIVLILAVYSLYLYAYSQDGKIFSGPYSFRKGKIPEFYLMFIHRFPLNLLIMKRIYFIILILILIK
uniref:NADH:ubiquinone reductase (H(+)-translocating) n=1 Tax=Glossina morsitans morsitans TaxID=37546 RepID=A0A1B0FBX3_GLOMM